MPISVVVCYRLQKKMHRMHQVGLLSNFFSTHALLEKVNSFLNMSSQIIYYCELFRLICLNSALLFPQFSFCIIKILIKTYFIIKFITNLRGKYIKIHFLTHFFNEQNMYTSCRLFLCTVQCWRENNYYNQHL